MSGGDASRPAPARPVLSPCIRLCAMDPADRYCLGCRRTRDEIAGWWAMDDAARRAVLAQLPQRRSVPPAPPA